MHVEHVLNAHRSRNRASPSQGFLAASARDASKRDDVGREEGKRRLTPGLANSSCALPRRFDGSFLRVFLFRRSAISRAIKFVEEADDA